MEDTGLREASNGDTCTICRKSYSSRETLTRHVRSVHKGEKRFACSHCSYTCFERYRMTQHLRSHLRQQNNNILLGEVTCSDNQGHDPPQDEISDDSSFPTNDGITPLLSSDSIVLVQIVSSDLLEISSCNSNTAHHPDDSCQQPSDISTVVQNLNFKTGIRNKETKEDVAQSLPSKGKSCPVCKKIFSSRANFRLHFRSVHGGEKSVTCLKCSYKCFTKYRMKVHLRSHSGERPYKCPDCPYSTVYSTNFYHLKYHAADYPFKCSFCSYTCKGGNTFQRHEQLHKQVTNNVSVNCKGNSVTSEMSLASEKKELSDDDDVIVLEEIISKNEANNPPLEQVNDRLSTNEGTAESTNDSFNLVIQIGSAENSSDNISDVHLQDDACQPKSDTSTGNPANEIFSDGDATEVEFDASQLCFECGLCSHNSPSIEDAIAHATTHSKASV